jgi:hypothetical protein
VMKNMFVCIGKFLLIISTSKYYSSDNIGLTRTQPEMICIKEPALGYTTERNKAPVSFRHSMPNIEVEDLNKVQFPSDTVRWCSETLDKREKLFL